MPTYQYACTDDACGLRFERVQSFTDDAITECPTCSHRVRKVYGSVGVVFKGSGFYRNDSREAASSTTPAVKSESGAGESGSKSAKTGSDGGSGGDSGSSSSSSSGSDSSAGSGSAATPAAKPAAKSGSTPVAG